MLLFLSFSASNYGVYGTQDTSAYSATGQQTTALTTAYNFAQYPTGTSWDKRQDVHILSGWLWYQEQLCLW